VPERNSFLNMSSRCHTGTGSDKTPSDLFRRCKRQKIHAEASEVVVEKFEIPTVRTFWKALDTRLPLPDSRAVCLRCFGVLRLDPTRTVSQYLQRLVGTERGLPGDL